MSGSPELLKAMAWPGARAVLGQINVGHALHATFAPAELTIIAHLSGGPIEGEHRVAGKPSTALPMRRGSVAVLPPDIDVRCICDPAVVPLRFLSVTLDKTLLPEDVAQHLHRLTYRMNEDLREVHGLMRQLEATLESASTDIGKLYLEHATLALVALALKSADFPVVTARRRGGLAPWQLKRTQDAMQARLDEDFGLNELAAIASCSPTHFSRAFKQSTGVAPFHWLNERRIERAKELLAQSPMSLAEIALAVGFSGQPQFTTAFGRATGVTPGQWRRDRLF